ncbi:hypothetical protein MP228_005709 [Amoeboaphelidium protococcarum]|nr:hypothetical protein MP228_005709 [Amoeboaphelidium protococcarum]
MKIISALIAVASVLSSCDAMPKMILSEKGIPPNIFFSNPKAPFTIGKANTQHCYNFEKTDDVKLTFGRKCSESAQFTMSPEGQIQRGGKCLNLEDSQQVYLGDCKSDTPKFDIDAKEGMFKLQSDSSMCLSDANLFTQLAILKCGEHNALYKDSTVFNTMAFSNSDKSRCAGIDDKGVLTQNQDCKEGNPIFWNVPRGGKVGLVYQHQKNNQCLGKRYDDQIVSVACDHPEAANFVWNDQTGLNLQTDDGNVLCMSYNSTSYTYHANGKNCQKDVFFIYEP